MKRTLVFLVSCVLVGSIGWGMYVFARAVFDIETYEDGVPTFPEDPSFVQKKVKDAIRTMRTDLGDWTPEALDDIIRSAARLSAVGDQVSFISEQFLGTPYMGNTLTGDEDGSEYLTVNLAGLDCFTYLDYVEAARQSGSYGAFVWSLLSTRYKDGFLDFQGRNHFFSDWVEYNHAQVSDVTGEVGGDAAVSVAKQLNQKKDGSVFLEGIPIVPRTITYIPTVALTDEVLQRLRTGDYIGIYTDLDGLDVTHTGIFINNDRGIYLRHASSREGVQQVLDDDFLTYLKDKPGIVVYRPQ
ncbi:MAG: DUF1460 domain-containing protein [Candidatus Kaiserbacteria bacterium]|nr:DUF1460 domain-containing protein [Candidatus Kaiserbacteria bacterium]